MDAREPKVYRMNDFDWMVATSLEEAVEWYDREADGLSEIDDPRELTDEELDRLLFLTPEEAPDTAMTFREALHWTRMRGDKIPGFFASTEY